MKAGLLIKAQARATVAARPAHDDAIQCRTLTNAGFDGRPKVMSRRTLDVLVSFLCLLILTLATGWMLVQGGIGQVLYPSRVSTSGNSNLNALLTAIEQNDVPAARRVLQKKRFDVNTADKVGVPPINYALLARGAGANELVELLIAAGSDVNGRGSDGISTLPLLSAATLRRPDLVKQLLNAGADVKGALSNGWTALHFAAMYDDSETVAVLLAAGADPDAVDDEGDTPLAVSLADGLSAVAAALLARSHSDQSPQIKSGLRPVGSVRRQRVPGGSGHNRH
jgi:ankyrin repeat protein